MISTLNQTYIYKEFSRKKKEAYIYIKKVMMLYAYLHEAGESLIGFGCLCKTWMRTTVWPRERRLSTAHLRAN